MARKPTGGRDEAAVRQRVEELARTFSDWGFPPMAARVLMTVMMAEEDSLTAAELAERLAVSPAAVSGAVRYLDQLGMLDRVPVPGSRRDRYRLPEDSWYHSTMIKGTIYRTLARQAADTLPAVGGADTAAGTRMAEMRDFMEFVDAEVGQLVDRWRSRRPKS